MLYLAEAQNTLSRLPVTTATLRTLSVEFCAESSGNVNAICADWTELRRCCCCCCVWKFLESSPKRDTVLDYQHWLDWQAQAGLFVCLSDLNTASVLRKVQDGCRGLWCGISKLLYSCGQKRGHRDRIQWIFRQMQAVSGCWFCACWMHKNTQSLRCMNHQCISWMLTTTLHLLSTQAERLLVKQHKSHFRI